MGRRVALAALPQMMTVMVERPRVLVKLAEAGPSSPRGVAWPRIRAGNGGPGAAGGTAVLRTKARCGAALDELDRSGGRWSDA
eukprot:2109633-Alexandrium_andersonii.AAC.1